METEEKSVELLDLYDLIHGLDDPDAAVREAAVDALDRIVAKDPSALTELTELASDEDWAWDVALAGYLVHVGTPEAIEAAFPTIARDAVDDERTELLGALAGAEGLTDERLRAMLAEGPRNDNPVHRTAAEILGLRGVAEGYRVLLSDYGSRSLYDDLVARGPDGIRILCCTFPDCERTDGEIAERIAAHRKKTEGLVHELVADPSAGGARTAIEVLGYWDEPRNVDLLMEIAQDPSRDSHLREEAVVSLCRLEAPEAMDLLIQTLLDPGQVERLRWECASALGEIGKPDALEALASVARSDPDDMLRQIAESAIGSIQDLAA